MKNKAMKKKRHPIINTKQPNLRLQRYKDRNRGNGVVHMHLEVTHGKASIYSQIPVLTVHVKIHVRHREDPCICHMV